MNKPDLTPVTDADQSVEEGIRRTLSRARPRDAVLGEEDGLDRLQPAPVGGRPDRRHQELRPRRAGLGDADRADGRGRGGRRLSSRPRSSTAAGGRRRTAAPSPASRCSTPAVPGLRRRRGSRTPRSPTPRSPAGTSAAGSTTSWRWPGAAGAPGRTATSGPTCCVAEGAVDLAAEPELELYDMAALDVIVARGRRPVHLARRTARPAPAATRWPPTAGCTRRRSASSARSRATTTPDAAPRRDGVVHDLSARRRSRLRSRRPRARPAAGPTSAHSTSAQQGRREQQPGQVEPAVAAGRARGRVADRHQPDRVVRLPRQVPQLRCRAARASVTTTNAPTYTCVEGPQPQEAARQHEPERAERVRAGRRAAAP